jgi:hypothetical protein
MDPDEPPALEMPGKNDVQRARELREHGRIWE